MKGISEHTATATGSIAASAVLVARSSAATLTTSQRCERFSEDGDSADRNSDRSHK